MISLSMKSKTNGFTVAGLDGLGKIYISCYLPFIVKFRVMGKVSKSCHSRFTHL